MSPRRARSQLSIYANFHVTARGNAQEDIFLDDEDRLHYLTLIERYRKRFGLRCFAYCLMPNHIHLLFRAPSIQVLSKTMHALQVAYVMRFNHRHKRVGHLFQDRFSSWVVETQEHFLAAIEYIENNPVKAGLVKSNRDYRWSSSARDGSLVSVDAVIG